MIEIQKTVVYMDERQAKQWLLMEFLNSVGVFDLKLGRVTIDFDKDGAIGNVKIEQNFEPQKVINN